MAKSMPTHSEKPPSPVLKYFPKLVPNAKTNENISINIIGSFNAEKSEPKKEFLLFSVKRFFPNVEIFFFALLVDNPVFLFT